MAAMVEAAPLADAGKGDCSRRTSPHCAQLRIKAICPPAFAAVA